MACQFCISSACPFSAHCLIGRYIGEANGSCNCVTLPETEVGQPKVIVASMGGIPESMRRALQ